MTSVSSIQEILTSNHNYWIADQSNTLVKASVFTFYFEKFKGLVSCFFLQDRTAQPLLEKALRKLVTSETYSQDLLNRTEQAAVRLGIKNLKKEKIQKTINAKMKEIVSNSLSKISLPKKDDSKNVNTIKENLEKDKKLASQSFFQMSKTKIAVVAGAIFAIGYITDRLLSLSTSECTTDWTVSEDPEFLTYHGNGSIHEAGRILDLCLERVNAHNNLPLYSKISKLF